MKRVMVLVVALGAVASGGALATACSSGGEEAAPTRPAVPIVDSGTGVAADAADAAPVDPGCVGANGCFKCEPKKNEEILNACTDGQCTPFDNAARLPLYKAGEALPPVP
jgi:hypothetical protein